MHAEICFFFSFRVFIYAVFILLLITPSNKVLSPVVVFFFAALYLSTFSYIFRLHAILMKCHRINRFDSLISHRNYKQTQKFTDFLSEWQTKKKNIHRIWVNHREKKKQISLCLFWSTICDIFKYKVFGSFVSF